MRMNCWLWARPSRRFLPRTKSNGTSRQKSKRCCGARIAAAAFAIDADVAVLAGSGAGESFDPLHLWKDADGGVPVLKQARKKTAVFAPIPSANAATVVAVKALL